MTIKELKRYRSMRREISDIEQQLAVREVTDCVQSASVHPYSKHSVPINGLPSDGDTITLLMHLDALRTACASCERYIDGIEDYQTREMFRLRFIEGKKYHQIARILGGMSEDCVRKRISRYVQSCPFCPF